MADFNEHINQLNKNIEFLENINTIDNCWEWKVTVCFYSAVHIVNAHLAKFDLHYRNHNATEEALNPQRLISVTKLDDDYYVAYKSLNNLSRRARYLCSEKPNQAADNSSHLTSDKHFAKAIRKLDKLFCYFSKRYSIDIKQIEISCVELSQNDNLKYFKLVKQVA